jgi:hypothetical protein
MMTVLISVSTIQKKKKTKAETAVVIVCRHYQSYLFEEKEKKNGKVTDLVGRQDLKGRAEANKKKIHLKNIKKIREYDEG